MSPLLLEVEGLEISVETGDGPVPIVRDVSFRVEHGERIGLVGESGSGKSLSALALLRLLPDTMRLEAERLAFEGRDLLALSDRQMRSLRGGGIGMVFQEPMSAMNPVFTIGFQIAEAIRAHEKVGRAAARARAVELLELVAMRDPETRVDAYPHQLSGGQRQRALIAMALAARPRLLIADEPTTALDVTAQARVLASLEELGERLSLAVLLITHDLGTVARICERVLVMYAGEIVEEAGRDALFGSPAHPYTRCLLAALPRLGHPAPRGELPTISGTVPEPDRRPSGCAFHPRCPAVMKVCREHHPPVYAVGPNRTARCFLHGPVGEPEEAM